MQMRNFGRLGRISALTLGGGGIGAVWGSTDRREAVATVHAALDAGITMLDLAPSYGDDFESERAAGEALRSRPGADLLITSKVQLVDDTERDFAARIRRSLDGSLSRIGRDHLDLLLLHTQIRTDAPHPGSIGLDGYREAVEEFERLRDAGRIRAWGITAVGHPDSVLAAFAGSPAPDAAQIVVNPLDMNGDLWFFPEARPRTDELIRSATTQGVQVVGIRAVAAGSLTASLDRTVPAGHPAAVDFARAEPFRKLAAELGTTPAALAHRYALTVPGVSTVVLGVKNRAELDECLAAEAAGPLPESEMDALWALRSAL
ncbi:aryl-alcohol dehydrogenase-like predicted oxidoreductase [Actinoplanes octamycinicus]|uniref:Aryl-alcohol dehydrogenase-like predicted oxidoreductase n=1 Tax=Actinoplanes octamycinicus TaxID=135948 RepID=A0A7W7H883_9ACTN|nr:aldo/keto reductase [Actinoplanes octamycinicus]MBB4745694.1 aryl-alcohol dehydrogenase-like predicted oxidoreductase [Actinoplanes octamycinicus]GIE56539.1 aldo/keto reductase [Actinoplanes octamycinicus]